MLNFKKGLALVLAAATALTFAPVANLGSSVTAEAAATIFDKIGDQTLTVGDNADYEINIPNLNTGAKFSVSTSNPSVAKIAAIYVNNTVVSGGTSTTYVDTGYSDGNYGVKDVPNGSQIRVFADLSNTGTSTIDITYTPQGGTTQHKTFVITVNAKSDVFGATKKQAQKQTTLLKTPIMVLVLTSMCMYTLLRISRISLSGTRLTSLMRLMVIITT